MEPDYARLAQHFKKSETIGIGAIDCQVEQQECGRHGVNGYPSVKAFVAGKPKTYNGGRDMDSMKGWIEKIAKSKGTGGGSAKCRPGMFKSKIKHAVVPLCEAHFPDQKGKNDWLVFFYDHGATAEMRDAVNKLALDLGNTPPDMNKAVAQQSQKKKRDRIESLVKEHDLKLKLPAKGPFGMEGLAKVGAVCCDCDDDHKAFCAGALMQGEEKLSPPQVYWVSKGTRKVLKDTEISAAALTQATMVQMGFAKETKSDL